MTDELIGKRIGGYEILSVIGRGGMATVYRAHQVSMNRTVALKILPRHFLNHEDYLQRFHREVKIVSQLEHRNIVPVHDYGEYEAQPYIAMRYMHGGSVDDVLQNGALGLEQIIGILEQVAPALDYAHAKNVLHRDLKPSNVLMDDDGGAYITDFGIARILSESGGTITTHGVVGTPSYMSPEQAQGQPLDNRSDVYALGVMLYEMVTGRRPFESDTPYGIAVLQVTTPPPPMRTFKPDVPAAVESVISNALRKHREERYASAAALLDAFRRAVREPAVSLSDTQPGMPRPDFTQPAPPVQVEYQTPPQVIYAPPASAHYTSSVQSIPAVPRVRRRKERGSNWWLSLLVGGVIGCGLLALLVIVAALLAENNRQEEERLLQTATADAASTLTATFAIPAGNGGGSPVPTADSTEAVSSVVPTIQPSDLPGAALSTNTPRAPAVVNTAPPSIPVETPFTGVAPVGVRPTPTPVPITAQGSILFFAERAGNYDIYRLDLPSLTETRLTNYGLSDTYPALSPDGQWIAFQSDRDGDFDIMLMEDNGNNIRRVVQNRVEDRIPSWSPDGEWILFSSDTRGDGNFDLFRVHPDGTDLQMIYSNGERNSHARWSPDGRTIVFTTGNPDDANTWEIARYDMQTSAVTLLTENNVRDLSPTFNPDGTRILYLTQGQGFGAIAEMDAASGRQRIIYDGAGYESSASYSTDGQYIVFTSDASGHDELYLIRADGTNLQQLTTRGGHYGTWIGDPHP